MFADAKEGTNTLTPVEFPACNGMRLVVYA
jgi:hypothetical protein